MRMGYVTLSEQGLILQANLSAATLLGLSRHMLVKQPISRFILKEDQDIYERHRRQPGLAQPCELRMVKNDGTPFWAHLAATGAQGKSGAPTLRVVLTDISESKRADEIHRGIVMQRELEQTMVTMVGIADNRQRSIGQDLHDNLGQRLVGISFLAKALEQELSSVDGNAAQLATSIARQAQDAVVECKNLAQVMVPVELESGGLMAALRTLAARTESLFRVTCRFECDQEVLVHDIAQSLNLYRIAQEASSNAVRHGGAQRVSISLSRDGGKVRLSIRDDGCGFPAAAPGATETPGMGVKIMRYRASLMRADLQLLRSAEGGAEVRLDLEPDMWSAGVVDREDVAVAGSGGRRN